MRAVLVLLPLFLLGAFMTPSALAFCEILEPPNPLPTQVNGTAVEITLTEGFARVVIMKEFYNPSNVAKEGQVFFPLERGHELITDLRLKVGNVVYNSSSTNREDALEEFLKAIAQQQDAALVQYDPPRDVYWVAVTIPPLSTRTTITTLEMPLHFHDGHYEYDYRLSVDARHSLDYLRVHLRVETTASLEHLHLPTHPDLPILRTGDHLAEAWINSTADAQGRDLQVSFKTEGTSLSQSVDEETGDRYLRLSMSVEDPLFADSLRPLPRSFLFAVDASGSMGQSGRWELVREAVRESLGHLNRGDTYGVLAFQGKLVLPMERGLRAWTPTAADEALAFLDGIHPRGSSNLTRAFSVLQQWAGSARAAGQQPVLVLLSDGEDTIGRKADLDLMNAYNRLSFEEDMPIFAFGVNPRDHSFENLLRNVSHFNRGDLVTLTGRDIRTPVASLMGMVRVATLHGVRAEILGDPAAELATNSQTVVQGGQLVVLAKTTGDWNTTVAMRLHWSGRDGEERTADVGVQGADVPHQGLLKKAWVLTRIHSLLERLRAREDSRDIAAVKDLGLPNRVVTPYTSLLVTIPRNLPVGGESDFAALRQGGVAASGSFGFGSIETPLQAEQRRAEAWRRDMSNPLIAGDEVDRWITIGSREHSQIRSTTPVRFAGSYVTVFEVGGELVAATSGSPSGTLSPVTSAPISASGLWLTLAVLAAAGIAAVRRPRKSEEGGTE